MAAVTVAATAWLAPRPADACGGLFCSSSQGQAVNQAAERIIFADNGDGTVTAVIEIQYEGEASKFAWLLPVGGVPKVELSSTLVFDQLQAVTNPTYTLLTTFEPCGGGCPNCSAQNAASPAAFGPTSAAAGGAAPDMTMVVVEASDSVGPYDYTVISVTPGMMDPAQVAVEWLTDNGYDVGDIGADVLRPYLEDDLNLLAFKLSKGNSAGAIRPVRLTWEATLPSIPIKPTAVAANDDMGVMVFMVGGGRAIPKNYKALELNEALIDWFNPMGTYNDVINLAADEAGGQGFVTEFAGDTAFLRNVIFNTGQRSQWNDFQAGGFESEIDLLTQAANLYGTWDGFDIVLSTAVSPNDPEVIQDALNCPSCQSSQNVQINPAEFMQALYDNVIEPVLETHDLLTSQRNITRLYTTMSADEMTVDPVFDQNADLPTVSNQHQATQVIECAQNAPSGTQPWRIELDNGDVVRGTQNGIWPVEMDSQPANRRIMQLTTTGTGEVVEDNRAAITRQLLALPDLSVDGDPANPSGGSRLRNPRTGSTGSGEDAPHTSGGLCSAAPGSGPASGLWLFAIAALTFGLRRRARGSALR